MLYKEKEETYIYTMNEISSNCSKLEFISLSMKKNNMCSEKLLTYQIGNFS